MRKIDKIKGWYIGEGVEEMSEEEAGKSSTDFDFLGSEERCEGRKVAVVCGVDVGRGLALSALAGTGGFVTVWIDEVENVEDSRDWSDWVELKDSRMMQRYRMAEQQVIEEFMASDAKPRKSWQTCYGPAQRGIKRR